jgi:hypothetical protein
MRTPIVKRHTSPESGFFFFFSAVPRSGVVRRRCRVLTGLPSQGATARGYPTHVLRCTHHLYGAGSDLWGVRCDLASRRDPRPVLCTGLAQRSARASAAQARERGRTRHRGRPRAMWARASARGPATGPAQGYRAAASRRVHRRRHPGRGGRAMPAPPAVARETPGARALLPEGRRKLSLAKAVVRWSRSETARTHGGARRVTACPWAGVCATRARDGWPASVLRSHSAAAADQAQVRCACPLFFPEVPTRLPPEAVAMCPGGRTRHSPARWGNGRAGGWRRAARG